MASTQVVDEAGVPGEQVGPVEDDADERARIRWRVGPTGPRVSNGFPYTPVAGTVDRRVEAATAEQDGVGDEAQQVLGVGQAAVDQVLEGLGDRGAGHGGQGGELGVGRGLAAEGQQRDAGGPGTAAEGVEGRLPRPPARRAGGPGRTSTPSRSGMAVPRRAGLAARTGGKPSGRPSTTERRARISVSALVRTRIIIDAVDQALRRRPCRGGPRACRPAGRTGLRGRR